MLRSFGSILARHLAPLLLMLVTGFAAELTLPYSTVG